MVRKIVVDVDETLYGFARAFYDYVQQHGYNFPHPEMWDHWGIFWMYIPKDQAFPIFDEVHKNQCKFKPYSDACQLLDFLSKHFYVIIASHRNPEYRNELEKWLKANNMKYNEVYAVFDKTFLFDDPEVEIVIDDRPETLRIATEHGKIALGLVKPWNKKCGKLNLFESLTDIQKYIEENYLSKR